VGAEVDEPFLFIMTSTKTHPPSNDSKKRKADESLILSEDSSIVGYPTFLVVEASSDKAIDQSIFGIMKLLKCGVGEVKSAKKLRNGSVLVEVASKAQAENALKMQNWAGVPVKVSPHRSLNSCKGVIRCRDLRDCSDEEILEALNCEGVTHVKHIFTKKNGANVPTNTFILTFNKPTLPKAVKAAYLHIPVEPYIPNPLRCFNCQKFGHGKSSCHHNAVCARCGNEGHSDDNCQEHPHCVNCSGPHPSFSRECPEWTKQRTIVQIKSERNVSFSEAKQLYMQQANVTTQRGKTFAAVLKATCSVSTQTIFTWPLDSKIPIATDSTTSSHQNIDTQTNTTSTQASFAASSNIPRYSSTPKQKIQLHNPKPGPASSKQGLGEKPGKGSNHPINLYNRFGSLDSMDLEANLSPKRGSGNRKNK
jgi:hypothetical protein